MGEFSGSNVKPVDLTKLNVKQVNEEILNEETVMGILGGFVKDMAQLAMHASKMNQFIKKEADKVKKEKGSLTPDDFNMVMGDILAEVMSMTNKAKLSDEMKKSFLQGMESKFQQLKK